MTTRTIRSTPSIGEQWRDAQERKASLPSPADQPSDAEIFRTDPAICPVCGGAGRNTFDTRLCGVCGGTGRIPLPRPEPRHRVLSAELFAENLWLGEMKPEVYGGRFGETPWVIVTARAGKWVARNNGALVHVRFHALVDALGWDREAWAWFGEAA